MLRKIIKKDGSYCLLACGHNKVSRGKNHAFCKICKEENLYLFKSYCGVFLFKSTCTKHASCMEKLALKCKWEQKFRCAILAEYSNIVCDKCRKQMKWTKVSFSP